MKLKLGFSPCPNDTFIFDALVNGKIDSEGLEFDVVLEDVETLNAWSALGKLDVTKLSFPALFQYAETYTLLKSGAALGNGVGPLLIGKSYVDSSAVNNSRIAIPGRHTTANFLLSFAFPQAKKKVAMHFSRIEDAVLNEEVDLGVIIHENRFTYQNKGLIKICDLGEVWEDKQQLPIPLGCIAAKKTLPQQVVEKMDRLIATSVQFALERWPQIPDYVKQHAQTMHEDVMRRHIELYVNEFTVNLKETGHLATKRLQQVYREMDIED